MTHALHRETETSRDDFEQYVLDIIKTEHPEWVGSDGDCQQCVAYYRSLDHAIQLVD